jgi:sugar phosphate isomerase/epimerase
VYIPRMSAPRIPIALQLYSVRDQCRRDLPGVLAAIGRMGYKGVEFAGSHGYSAPELRKFLNDNGLIACGAHKSLRAMKGDRLAATIEFCQTLGIRFILVPSMLNFTRGQWIRKAAFFNELAAKLRPRDLAIGYHAHAHDFRILGGETAWDIFFSHTQQEVIMQLDTGNCRDARVDPVEVLKKYPGRTRTIHVKARGGRESIIGSDDTDWKAVFEWCEGPGKTEWYVVEFAKSLDPIQTARQQLEALRRLGKC